jgi:hypothetical protein
MYVPHQNIRHHPSVIASFLWRQRGCRAVGKQERENGGRVGETGAGVLQATRSKVRVPAAGSSRSTMPSRSCMTSRVCSSCISSGSMPLAETFSAACAAGSSAAPASPYPISPMPARTHAHVDTDWSARRRCNSDRPPQEPRHQCQYQSPTGSRASRQQSPAPHSPCHSPELAAAPQRRQIWPEILDSGLSLGGNRLPSRRQLTPRGRWRPPATCQGRHIPTARPAAQEHPCLGGR